MKRNASRSQTRSLAEELAALRGLDPTALKQRWRELYRTEAPVRIGLALLQQAVAYRLQERALGGLKSSTRRLLERVVENHDSRRPPTAAPTTRVAPGSVLIREWHGVSHRVTVLKDGVVDNALISLDEKSSPQNSLIRAEYSMDSAEGRSETQAIGPDRVRQALQCVRFVWGATVDLLRRRWRRLRNQARGHRM